MTQIQGGRWDAILSKLFPVKSGAVAPAVGPEIVPTISVQNFDPEMYWLRREQLMSGGVIVGAAAGQYSQANLRNDSTDRLVIVELLMMASMSGVDTFRIALGNNAVGAAVSVFCRDTRRGLVITAGSVAGVIRSGTQAGAITGDAFLLTVPAANSMQLLPLTWVLRPNDALFITNTVVNRTMWASFAWRERGFEPGELT